MKLKAPDLVATSQIPSSSNKRHLKKHQKLKVVGCSLYTFQRKGKCAGEKVSDSLLQVVTPPYLLDLTWSKELGVNGTVCVEGRHLVHLHVAAPGVNTWRGHVETQYLLLWLLAGAICCLDHVLETKSLQHQYCGSCG